MRVIVSGTLAVAAGCSPIKVLAVEVDPTGAMPTITWEGDINTVAVLGDLEGDPGCNDDGFSNSGSASIIWEIVSEDIDPDAPIVITSPLEYGAALEGVVTEIEPLLPLGAGAYLALIERIEPIEGQPRSTLTVERGCAAFQVE